MSNNSTDGAPTPGSVFAHADKIHDERKARARDEYLKKLAKKSKRRILLLSGLILTALGFLYQPEIEAYLSALEAPGVEESSNVVIQKIQDEETFSPIRSEKPPENKFVSEMSDGEVLGILISYESEARLILQALEEATSRRVPTLLEASILVLQRPEADLRLAALDTLESLDDKRAVSKIILSLDDINPEVRARAALTLAALGDRSAIKFLRSRIKREKEEKVRKSIEKAERDLNGIIIE